MVTRFWLEGSMSSRIDHLILGLATLCSALGVPVAPAAAGTIQIPAIAFVVREVPMAMLGTAQAGVLTTAEGTYFAAAPLVDGQRVCQFSLVYRDNDADSQTIARLFRKRVIIDDVPFTPPVLMAVVTTGKATGDIGVKRMSTINIASPLVAIPGAFYYVEIRNTSDLLEVLGVEIDMKPVC
jgi:hypothetical protein